MTVPHRGGLFRRSRRTRCARAATAVVAAAALALSASPPVSALPSGLLRQEFAGSPQPVTVAVEPEADGTPVTLDGAIYAAPDQGRRPAVILAHGFGGSWKDLDRDARELAGRGYVVLAYSARGFGRSEGRIHLQDPQVDGKDVSRLVDLLASREDVQSDGEGDPRVGMAGSSYGGAATLIGGALDRRIDALAAGVTWNDLADAFFPSSVAADLPGSAAAVDAGRADAPGGAGVFKRRWASLFFSAGLGRSRGLSVPGDGDGDVASTVPPPPEASDGAQPTSPAAGASLCGRFDPAVCRLFLETAQSGTPSEEMVAELRRRSPARTNDQVTVPTLLVQGVNDSLFGLDAADANARQISAGGAPVAVQWISGGHDGGRVPPADSTYLPWFDTYLKGDGSAQERAARPLPGPGFTYPVKAGKRGAPDKQASAASYPGVGDRTRTETMRVPFTDAGRSGAILSPPGGDPSAVSSVPGAGGPARDAMSAAGYRLAALPGQHLAFDTGPVSSPATVVGSPRVRLKVTSTAADATLFVSLWKVVSGSPSPAKQTVAPVRVRTTPGTPTTVEVALPAGTYAFDQGTTWRVLVSSSDSAFATPTDVRSYTVALADDALSVPTLPTVVSAEESWDGEVVGLLIALGVLSVVVGAVAAVFVFRRRSGDAAHTREDLAEVPLSVSGLVKTYADGHRAVDDVSWQAGRGQVVGLLGPNGAGKTTTIRMIVGLITPDSGDVHVHGRPVHAGSPALAGIGALIEGPGFLPHLSGRANLEAYWDATGRPRSEACFEEALEVAALGGALDRPVKSYSQGMRQRLGIAQAMLGMPEVLLLDEPTNGLDPPQIAAMRPVLRRYAETGRTVVVSSHLLSEVEMTCSHVVVMHRGRVVLTGAVPDLVDSAETTVVELSADAVEAERVASSLRGLAEVDAVEVDLGEGTPRLVVRAGLSRPDVVAAVSAAGGRILSVGARRHLEEVFLGVIAAEDVESARQIRPR
ncbi:ABC-2 type transport system ATP-binding protein [Austwickia chelonae]|uniref:Putative ABC transporter ATP-binding protein n=1 Tax=Austwickia chelonae NBRC 105200 TaxID=1184607 RepID=K6VV08_9MICO|nr:alpha/beta fold hydrolase [Austwickia chelonae]GAB79170.1 putative ABC transporter ATP-binding protein [Austwickia chelonae NBRC 105200]SEW42901.1 ABC-2 type transport system ATP-binding protein [Austwickia chelonae]